MPVVAPHPWPRSGAVRVPVAVVARPVAAAVVLVPAVVPPEPVVVARLPEVQVAVVPVPAEVPVVVLRCLRPLSSKAVAAVVAVPPVAVRPVVGPPVAGPREPLRCRPRSRWRPRPWRLRSHRWRSRPRRSRWPLLRSRSAAVRRAPRLQPFRLLSPRPCRAPLPAVPRVVRSGLPVVRWPVALPARAPGRPSRRLRWLRRRPVPPARGLLRLRSVGRAWRRRRWSAHRSKPLRGFPRSVAAVQQAAVPVAAVVELPVAAGQPVVVAPERALRARPRAAVVVQAVPVVPVPRVPKARAVRVLVAPAEEVPAVRAPVVRVPAERAALAEPVAPEVPVARVLAAPARAAPVVLVPRSWVRCRLGRPLRQRQALRCCWTPGRSAR
ncbi:hypothetical protein BN977_00817 [Mycolicibacterium cosmeticum]|uniref:Uncharacterized protein n=1 Tax=Mycolicibacterium cosmeticum TaxID=258533 RepID=W9AKQ3_MYCCO|nr:hypothetical protein BN977_00817 [Mycolicibacterium cosmeticum]